MYSRPRRRDRGKGRHGTRLDLNGKSKPAKPRSFGSEPSPEVCEVEQRLQMLSPDEVLIRYHDLIDQRIAGHLGPMQAFELSRVESRLDAEDEDELCLLAEFQEERQRTHNELVTRIEELLTRLKGAA